MSFAFTRICALHYLLCGWHQREESAAPQWDATARSGARWADGASFPEDGGTLSPVLAVSKFDPFFSLVVLSGQCHLAPSLALVALPTLLHVPVPSSLPMQLVPAS